MSRLVLAASLATAGLGAIAAAPVAADRTWHSRLDTDGKPIATDWSETGRFDSLTAAGLDNVRVVSGDRWRIRATGDARALAQLRYLVDDGSLIVGRLSGRRESFGKAQIEITAPSLRAVTAAGSGALDVERMAGERATATVAGSGRVELRRVEAERLVATIAGSGGLAIAGRSDRADFTIAGSGSLAGGRFTARTANVTVAGSGDASLRSPGEVRATLVGSGSVKVAGTTNCRQTRMGSGRLSCTA